MNCKEQLINSLIKDGNYKKYLEIGTQYGNSINKVYCEIKHTVDPVMINRPVDAKFFNMTSDEFFRDLSFDELYDIIFIDGLHHADQVLTDICNSGARIASDGCLVVHDLLPAAEINQKVPRECQVWNGDAWKAFYLLLKGNYDLSLEVHDFDHGVGVIRFGRNGLDQILCDFSDNLDRLDHVTYKLHFEEYKKLAL